MNNIGNTIRSFFTSKPEQINVTEDPTNKDVLNEINKFRQDFIIKGKTFYQFSIRSYIFGLAFQKLSHKNNVGLFIPQDIYNSINNRIGNLDEKEKKLYDEVVKSLDIFVNKMDDETKGNYFSNSSLCPYKKLNYNLYVNKNDFNESIIAFKNSCQRSFNNNDENCVLMDNEDRNLMIKSIDNIKSLKQNNKSLKYNDIIGPKFLPFNNQQSILIDVISNIKNDLKPEIIIGGLNNLVKFLKELKIEKNTSTELPDNPTDSVIFYMKNFIKEAKTLKDHENRVELVKLAIDQLTSISLQNNKNDNKLDSHEYKKLLNELSRLEFFKKFNKDNDIDNGFDAIYRNIYIRNFEYKNEIRKEDFIDLIQEIKDAYLIILEKEFIRENFIIENNKLVKNSQSSSAQLNIKRPVDTYKNLLVKIFTDIINSKSAELKGIYSGYNIVYKPIYSLLILINKHENIDINPELRDLVLFIQESNTLNNVSPSTQNSNNLQLNLDAI